ncbi:hypothetical protein [Brucella pituitosa]|uniref:hypothetical protein n=1 Tax=Brucella pituitosa TaxID=571256 RepID=UPI0011B04DC4
MRSTAVFFTALLTIALLQNGVAFAEGFKPLDFHEDEKEITQAFGSDFKVSIKDSMISVDDFQGQTIKLLIDRQNADVGQKDMSDAAYFLQLEEACNQQGLPCQINKLSVGSLVGRMTSIRLAGGRVSVNLTFLKDGDRLTIRSAAKTKDIAQKNAEIALGAVRDKL